MGLIKDVEDFNFRYVGNIEVDNILEKVNQLTNADWEEYNFRQIRFKPHIHTQTIPIIFDEDFRNTNPSCTKWYSIFESDIDFLKKKISKFYGGGYIIRCILTKLISNKSIPTHIDVGMSLSMCKRIHIPIVTNDSVIFTVDNEKKNLKTGEMWEINNCKCAHSVENNSDIDRIHLIIDYVPYQKNNGFVYK